MFQQLGVIFIGIILGMTCYTITKNYFFKKGQQENVIENKSHFTIKSPKAKIVYNTLILLFWVIMFSLYMNNLVFTRNIFMTALFVFVVVVTFFRVQKIIHKTIEIYGNMITDNNGNTYYFSDFTECRINKTGAMMFKDGIVVFKVEKDDIGYELFVKKVKHTGVKVYEKKDNKK